jgi:hypothetical protein
MIYAELRAAVVAVLRVTQVTAVAPGLVAPEVTALLLLRAAGVVAAVQEAVTLVAVSLPVVAVVVSEFTAKARQVA